MASLPAQVTRSGARWLALLTLTGLLLASGCFHLDRTTSEKPKSSGPAPTRVVVAWSPRVEYAADPTRGGAMNPGVAGRLYLFGEDLSFPLVCEGSVHVELYDISPKENGPVKPNRLEEWKIDPVTLQKVLRKDLFGQGYTLFLPWATYRPEITKIQLRTTFTPTAGPSPLYGSPSVVNLASPFATGGAAAQHGPIGQNLEQKSMKPPPTAPAAAAEAARK